MWKDSDKLSVQLWAFFSLEFCGCQCLHSIVVDANQ